MITFSKEQLEQLSPAFEAIGTMTEHELTPAQCAKLAMSLDLLADFTRQLGITKRYRANIENTANLRRDNPFTVLASEANAKSDAAFDCLPTEFKW